MRRCTCAVGAHQVKETQAPDQICFSLSCTVDVVSDSLMDFVRTHKLEPRMHAYGKYSGAPVSAGRVRTDPRKRNSIAFP